MSFIELKSTILSLTYPSLAISSFKSVNVMSRTGYSKGIQEQKYNREKEKKTWVTLGDFPQLLNNLKMNLEIFSHIQFLHQMRG